MGIAVTLTIGSFILTTFTRSVDWLKDYEMISIFHYFPAATIAKSEIDIRDVIVYAVIIIVFLGIGIIGFRRRDVR
jgi:putative exporter of polyketide antibiotics